MQPRLFLRSLASAVASLPLVLGACSSSDDASNGAAAPAAAEPTPAASRSVDAPEHAGHATTEACPTAVAGATVRAADVEGGAALEVTTTGDVESVRTRARAMAEHHSRQSHDPGTAPMRRHGPGSMGDHQGPRRGPMMHDDAHVMADAEIRVEDLDGGARLVFMPRDPGDLDAVRTHARRLAERMAQGDCPAMM